MQYQPGGWRRQLRNEAVLKRTPSYRCYYTLLVIVLRYLVHQVYREDLLYSLLPAYYMYNNVIYNHCYRFLMYFSNFILYVYYKSLFLTCFFWLFFNEAHYIFFLIHVLPPLYALWPLSQKLCLSCLGVLPFLQV